MKEALIVCYITIGSLLLGCLIAFVLQIKKNRKAQELEYQITGHRFTKNSILKNVIYFLALVLFALTFFGMRIWQYGSH